MQRVTLQNTAIETSALGFGCVGLTRHATSGRALRLLDLAYELGITHYDVARLYGYGQAEGILGRFIERKRDRVTITTKVGLNPPATLASHRRLIYLARHIARRLPFLPRLLRRPGPKHAAQAAGRPNPAFGPDEAARSLETSLRELRTDYIDLWLLHECTLQDACREDLLAFLENQVTAGKIRCYGVGTAFKNLLCNASLLPTGFRVLQFECDPLASNVGRLANRQGRDIITHSALAPLRSILSEAQSRPDTVRRYAGAVGGDLNDPHALSSLLLHYAMAANPGGLVLFATTRSENLVHDVRVADESPYTTEQLSAFQAFVRELMAPHQCSDGRSTAH